MLSQYSLSLKASGNPIDSVYCAYIVLVGIMGVGVEGCDPWGKGEIVN